MVITIGTYKPPSTNCPCNSKNYLHITAFHMITFYYWEILIFSNKNMKDLCDMIELNISLKIQHVSIAQTPHILIIFTLTKIHCLSIRLLSREVFLTIIV